MISSPHAINADVRSLAEYEGRTGGLAPRKKIAFYCGTGRRASLAFLYARALGFPRIGVYDGGWMEWSGASTSANTALDLACAR